MHDAPTGQGLQVLAPAIEYEVPEHFVAIPFTQNEPAGQGLHVLAPVSEYEVPEHFVAIPFTQDEPAGQVKHTVALAPENDPGGHCDLEEPSHLYPASQS